MSVLPRRPVHAVRSQDAAAPLATDCDDNSKAMPAIDRVRRWWFQRLLRKHRIPLHQWEDALSQAPALWRLNTEERHRLRLLATRFLHEKTFVGVQGLDVTEAMRVSIGAQACLPILNLDLDYYAGWREIVLYPDTFIVAHEVQDAAGVVHATRRALDGEAWDRGPVILSWHDIRPGAHPDRPGANVILHEFAHKLDMRNGAANGMPPLHADVSRPDWTAALTAAYDDLRDCLDRRLPAPVNPYGAESPAEFFAVLTELFFEQPQHLQTVYPDVYRVFGQFYRQDPARSSPNHKAHEGK